MFRFLLPLLLLPVLAALLLVGAAAGSAANGVCYTVQGLRALVPFPAQVLYSVWQLQRPVWICGSCLPILLWGD